MTINLLDLRTSISVQSWVAISLLGACGPVVDSDTEIGTDGSSSTAATLSSTPSDSGPAPDSPEPVPPPLSTSTTDDSTSTSTGPTSVTGDDGNTSWAETGSTFISPTGGHIPVECSTFGMDCPPDFKCVPVSIDDDEIADTAGCQPIPPEPAGVGEPCTAEGGILSGIDDCDAGALCWEVDPQTLQGTCVAFCVGSLQDPACPQSGEVCTFVAEGSVPLCLPAPP